MAQTSSSGALRLISLRSLFAVRFNGALQADCGILFIYYQGLFWILAARCYGQCHVLMIRNAHN
jgi:hypothetical protein